MNQEVSFDALGYFWFAEGSNFWKDHVSILVLYGSNDQKVY